MYEDANKGIMTVLLGKQQQINLLREATARFIRSAC